MKKCIVCHELMTTEFFYRNRTKPDGLQTYCKTCDKTKYMTKLTCSECGVIFELKHRNYAKRKTRLCRPCTSKMQSKKIIAQNKKNAKPLIYNTKGYAFERTVGVSNGYTLKHRLLVSEFLKRSLTSKEIVHHIDGTKTNNELANLWLTDNSGHRKAHRSLEIMALLLYDSSLVEFDKEKGVYCLGDKLSEMVKLASRSTVNAGFPVRVGVSEPKLIHNIDK